MHTCTHIHTCIHVCTTIRYITIYLLSISIKYIETLYVCFNDRLSNSRSTSRLMATFD